MVSRLYLQMYFTVLSVPYSHVVTCTYGEIADHLALLRVMFFLVFFFIFRYGASGQVYCLIVSIPDLCFLLYFYKP